MENDSLKQLPLNFKNTENKTFQKFVLGQNSGLITSLQSFAGSNESLFYLWGDSGSGKTHVLQAFINALHSKEQSAAIILPKKLSDRQNVSLLAMFDYVCIDGIETIATNSQLEEALFFWINEVRAENKKIILSSQLSNQSQKWQLPDLVSRLQSGRTHEIINLNRQQALAVFKQQAIEKGIIIDANIEKYLHNNCPMNVKFLSQLLQHLDDMTLIQKKPVTIPLLKNILQTVLVH